MRHLKIYENFEKNLEKFKIGEYAIITAFNNMRVKIVDVTDKTIWVENEDGHRAEFNTNGIIPEVEFYANKYNV